MNRMKSLLIAVLVVSSTLVLTNIPAAGQNFAYVANGLDNTVSVISTTSDTVVQTIPVANSPFGVAITPNGKFAYVSSQSGVLTVIDTATNSVARTFPIGGAPFGLAFSPDGTKLYVTNPGYAQVTVVDPNTGNVVGMTDLSSYPYYPLGISISPDGSRAYVTTFNCGGVCSGSLLVLDTTSNQLANVVPVGNAIFGVATTGDGKHVYIADEVGSSWDMDTSTYSVTPVPSAFGSQVPAITPDNSKVYITGADGLVSAINTSNDALISTFPVGSGQTQPYFVAFTPDGKKAYITDSAAGAVAVVDTGTNGLLSRITVGANPEQVATIPPQPPVPFSSFQGSLQIGGSGKSFQFNGNFSLGPGSVGIHPLVDPMSLQIGSYVILVPAGSLAQAPHGAYVFQGTINGVKLQIRIASASASYSFQSEGAGASGLPTSGTTRVVLTIGNNTGSITLRAHSN